MKIAVSSMGKSATDQVDSRLGRASYFMITEDDGKTWQVFDHSDVSMVAQGAGVQTAQKLADAGVQVVITGHVGPKAYTALKSNGVEMYAGASGSVQEAFEAYKQGKLQSVSQPDVKGHWGQGGS